MYGSNCFKLNVIFIESKIWSFVYIFSIILILIEPEQVCKLQTKLQIKLNLKNKFEIGLEPNLIFKKGWVRVWFENQTELKLK